MILTPPSLPTISNTMYKSTGFRLLGAHSLLKGDLYVCISTKVIITHYFIFTLRSTKPAHHLADAITKRKDSVRIKDVSLRRMPLLVCIAAGCSPLKETVIQHKQIRSHILFVPSVSKGLRSIYDKSLYRSRREQWRKQDWHWTAYRCNFRNRKAVLSSPKVCWSSRPPSSQSPNWYHL